jgi:hypothetical protein
VGEPARATVTSSPAIRASSCTAAVRVTIVPVRHHWRDEEWQVERSRVVGYRAIDTSGWKGPVRSDRVEAASDATARRAELAEEG